MNQREFAARYVLAWTSNSAASARGIESVLEDADSIWAKLERRYPAQVDDGSGPSAVSVVGSPAEAKPLITDAIEFRITLLDLTPAHLDHINDLYHAEFHLSPFKKLNIGPKLDGLHSSVIYTEGGACRVLVINQFLLRLSERFVANGLELPDTETTVTRVVGQMYGLETSRDRRRFKFVPRI